MIGFWFNKKQRQSIRETVTQWIASFRPTHFLSVQFPIHRRKRDFDKAQEDFEKVMRKMQLYLFRKHWRNKHQPFFVSVEHNRGDGWHYHVYFYNTKFTTWKLRNALNRVAKNKQLSSTTFDLAPIDHTPDIVHWYGTQQIKPDCHGHFDPIIFTHSYILFDIPVDPLLLPQNNNQTVLQNNNRSLQTVYEWVIFWLICLLWLPRPVYNTS